MRCFSPVLNTNENNYEYKRVENEKKNKRNDKEKYYKIDFYWIDNHFTK